MMNFSKEQQQILLANGWVQSVTGIGNTFYRGNEQVSISGNIIKWSDNCKTYAPSLENFKYWAKDTPKYFDPAVKAKVNSNK